MNTTVHNKAIMKFSIILIIISVPFWILGAFATSLAQYLPMNLPASAMMVFNPMIAALILVYKGEGFKGIKQLLKKAFDFKSIKQKVWYIPIIFIMPVILLLSYYIMLLLEVPMPDAAIHFASIPILFLLYYITAIGEEIGWMGYLAGPMLRRWSALKAGIILGAMWSIWHVIPYFQGSHDLPWVIWQCIFSIAARVLIVWLYVNNNNSMPAAIIFHAMINLSVTLFPINGSHYNPAITGIITIIAAAIVTLLWSSSTLTHYRQTKNKA